MDKFSAQTLDHALDIAIDIYNNGREYFTAQDLVQRGITEVDTKQLDFLLDFASNNYHHVFTQKQRHDASNLYFLGAFGREFQGGFLREYEKEKLRESQIERDIILDRESKRATITAADAAERSTKHAKSSAFAAWIAAIASIMALIISVIALYNSK